MQNPGTRVVQHDYHREGMPSPILQVTEGSPIDKPLRDFLPKPALSRLDLQGDQTPGWDSIDDLDVRINPPVIGGLFSEDPVEFFMNDQSCLVDPQSLG